MRYFFIISFLLFKTVYAQPNLQSLGLKPLVVNNCTNVKDQFMSGTCWSFASMSFLESEILRKEKKTVDLSEMFIARYSYIRKVEKFLQSKGKTYFTPGGQFHDVVWVLKNYGAVPEQAYSGLKKGERFHIHSLLDTAMEKYVKQLKANNVINLTKENRIYIDSLLDKHLGKVPASFIIDGKEYTPQSYLKEYLKINLADYIEITSYTHHPFYTSFILEDKYNWTSDAYYNLPIEDLLTITNNCLNKNLTVAWDGDVDDATFKFENGLAYLPNSIANYQIERQKTFLDSTTDIDHVMHIVALTKDKNGNDWYYVKNSWGNYSNSLKGFLFMSKDYFAIKTSAIIVNKNDMPISIRKKMKL